jgi:hypothetical protein
MEATALKMRIEDRKGLNRSGSLTSFRSGVAPKGPTRERLVF